MSETLHLLVDGLDDQGCAQAHVQHGDASAEVDKRVAVNVDDNAAVGTLGKDRHRGTDSRGQGRLPACRERQGSGPGDGRPYHRD